MTALYIMEKPSDYVELTVDQDGLWKKVIGELFDDFLLFVAPELYEYVDFTKKPDFLQQELFQEVVDEKKGRRSADQLVKVYLRGGGEQWILIHVEVQGVNEEDFSARMFQYFYRIFDRYEQKIVALAIMTSPYKNKYPESFRYDFFGTTLHYEYTIRKVSDYDDDMLRNSESLFSKIILAAKYLHKTNNEEQKRYVFKRQLMRELIRNQSYSRLSLQATLHFVDYLLKLPKDLEQQLFHSIYPLLGEEKKLMELYNKDNASPTIYNAFDMERIQGREEGREEGIIEARKSIARNLLKQSLSVEAIKAATQLSIEEIEVLQKELQ